MNRRLHLLCLALLAVAAQGCNIDIIRSRAGNPLRRQQYERLEPQKSTRGEALDILGAPEKLEWKNGKDYFWYLYKDELDSGVRFQFPPFRTAFGYQHTLLRLNEAAEDTNAIELVFNEEGILERKSIRLPDTYDTNVLEGGGWKLHAAAHLDYSAVLFGDGGVASYSKLFEPGFRTGLSCGWQPVPVLTLLGRGSYQNHAGGSFRKGGRDIDIGDLHLYGAEVGVRLGAPIELLWSFTNYDKVRRMMIESDMNQASGIRIYLEGMTGIMLNSNVTAKVDGVRAGKLYDNDYQFSGTIEAGLEYGWSWGTAHIGASYQSIDGFNEGNTNLDDSAGTFQAILVGGGLSFRF